MSLGENWQSLLRAMVPEKPTKTPGQLIWIVQVASAFSLATLAALVCSIHSISPTIRIYFTPITLVAFVLTGVLSLFFWQAVFLLSGEDAGKNMPNPRPRRRLIWIGSLLVVGVVVGFLYPLKDFSREKQIEFAVGGLVAIFFLGMLGILFWRVVRFLNEDEKKEGSHQI